MDLKSFFSRKSEPAPDVEAQVTSEAIMPEQTYFVIGDLSGRADLLEQMLEQIDGVIGAEHVRDPVLVFVGNIVGYGPQTRHVLLRMRELTEEFPNNIICLMGSHEKMLLDFLASPAARLARWMREGGAAICESFGVVADPDHDPDALAATLAQEIGPELLDWLQARPLSRQSGNLFVVHAGADPVRDIDDQTDRVKIWGHPEFLSRARVDGHWVAHGHHVVERAVIHDNRISLNTEAWRSGVLSCAYIPPSGDIRLMQAVMPRA